MKIRHLPIFLFTFLFGSLALAQENPNPTYRNLGLKAGYFGEFVMHPGAYLGIDYTISQKTWLNVHWDSEMGLYFHKWNNNSVFVQSSIGARFISSFAGFIDLSAGLGYMLSTPNGDVYTARAANELTSDSRPFTSHMKPSISLLFGWDGTRKKDIPLLINAGLEAYWQSNVNQSMLPHAALRLGIVYKLKK